MHPLYTQYKYWMWKCSAPIKVACAQTRSVPIKLYGILGGRGVGKGDRAQNCWKFTPISGAEALSAPPLYPIIEWKWIQSRRLAPKLEVCHWNATGFSGVGVQGRGPGLKIVGKYYNIHRFLWEDTLNSLLCSSSEATSRVLWFTRHLSYVIQFPRIVLI